MIIQNWIMCYDQVILYGKIRKKYTTKFIKYTFTKLICNETFKIFKIYFLGNETSDKMLFYTSFFFKRHKESFPARMPYHLSHLVYVNMYLSFK